MDLEETMRLIQELEMMARKAVYPVHSSEEVNQWVDRLMKRIEEQFNEAKSLTE